MVRKISLLLIICFSLLKGIYAQTEKSIGLLVQQKDYSKIIQVLEAKADSSELTNIEYFNLGSAYCKRGDLGLGRLNLERAALLNPRHRGTVHNIKWVQTELSNDIASIPQFFISKYWNYLSSMLNPLNWKIIGIILLWLAAFLGFKKFKEENKSGSIAGKTAIVILLFIGLLFFALATTRTSVLNDDGFYVVMLKNATLKVEPEEEGEIAESLPTGTKLEVLNGTGLWAQVTVEDGARGWVEKKFLESIKL